MGMMLLASEGLSTFWTAFISAVVSIVVGSVITALVAWAKSHKKHTDALYRAVQSQLRRGIIQDHDKYVDLGFCPVHIKQSITANYESYHELGGNGVIDKLYKDILELPEKKKED